MRRDEVLAGLEARAGAGHALLAVGAATGLVARAAERGGANLIVVYNSGLYRSHGHSSLAGLMPYGDANSIVVDMGRKVLPAVDATPVLAGVCATDPFRSMPRFLCELRDMGFAGVQNFPTVGLIDGRFREELEATGIRFDLEVEMVAAAHQLGLLTCAFVCDPDSAAAMAQAGADVVAPHLGVTQGRGDLAEAADRIQEMRDAAVAVRPDVLVLFHGGPASGPEEVRHVLEATRGVAGFFAASTIERTPVEKAAEAAARSFADLTIAPDSVGSSAREPREHLDRDNLPGYLRRHGLVPADGRVEVEDLGGGISNALMLYRYEDDRAVVKQSRSRIRVDQEWLCDVRRILAERDAIEVVTRLLPPGSVPRIRFSDDENYLFIMDAAPEDARLWKSDLLAGDVDDSLARAAGSILAAIHRGTAGDVAVKRRFGTSLLSQLRIDPFYMATALHHPQLRTTFEKAVRQLLGSRRALVHGDFVPKNMLVSGDNQLILLDYEIAHYGNPAYDLATFVNHLLLKRFALPECSDKFGQAVREFLQAYAVGADSVDPPEEQVLLQLGCLMLGRIDGKSPVEYITEEHVKARVREVAFAILWGELRTIDDVLERCSAESPVR